MPSTILSADIPVVWRGKRDLVNDVMTKIVLDIRFSLTSDLQAFFGKPLKEQGYRTERDLTHNASSIKYLP